MNNNSAQYTFIDLFSGCGGFSLGLKWAGLKELAAIDVDPNAVEVFKKNFPELGDNILREDLLKYEPRQLAKVIGTNHVDVIVGGPPCQGFSKVRQRDGANSGNRIIDDKRRELYQEFLKFVKHFKPKIFVMENVLGIRSADGGHFFNRVQFEARKLGYRVHGEVIKAWEYGVPQKRQRQLIIGTQLDLPLFSSHLFMIPSHGLMAKDKKQKFVSLWEAIGDLPPIKAGQGEEKSGYDLIRRSVHLAKYSGRYTLDVLGVDRCLHLTAHRARPHLERDLRDFNALREGETARQAMARGIQMEFPYDKETFKDRYTKQHRGRLCSTIVAHLSKDGLMFIHPTQNRSLTPREAARVQSFPDWFEFPVSRKQQYILIGNAVPPLVGKAVGSGVLKWFANLESYARKRHSVFSLIDENKAINWLMEIVSLDGNGKLSKLATEDFKRGWFALAYLYSHLHPDSAREGGTAINAEALVRVPQLAKVNTGLEYPIFERSGWPVLLTPIGVEAYKRFVNGALSVDEYYCSELFIAGSASKGRNHNGRHQDP
jgi:DNA (cytosine-5)-methyltransferase 1